MNLENNHYYEHLAELYPTISSASSEIINLQSILHLPKGTEHFLSDIHGEYESFLHILRNASGVIKDKIAANKRQMRAIRNKINKDNTFVTFTNGGQSIQYWKYNSDGTISVQSTPFTDNPGSMGSSTSTSSTIYYLYPHALMRDGSSSPVAYK